MYQLVSRLFCIPWSLTEYLLYPPPALGQWHPVVEFKIAPSELPLAIDAPVNVIVMTASGEGLTLVNQTNFNGTVTRSCITINLNDMILDKGLGANLFNFVLVQLS